MAYYPYDDGSRYTTTECDPIEVRFSSLESQVSDLTDVVKQMIGRKAQPVGMFGMHPYNAYPMETCQTFYHNTEPTYNYGGSQSSCQGVFEPYSSTYYPGWQDHPIPNEYNEYQWQEPPYSSYEQTPSTAHHSSESSGMSLEEMVQLIALNTQLFSFQREAFRFQQEARAQVQDLKDQINEYISSQSRWEAQDEELGLVDKWKIETFIEEEDDEEVVESTSHSHINDTKGEDVEIQNPMVVTPLPFLTPIVDLIKEEEEEECVDIWGTFTELEEPMVENKKVNPDDNAFAELPRETSLACKGYALEIRTDFKAPQHVEKEHVWGIDLLDTG